jgi:GWxTD domain-containing protein
VRKGLLGLVLVLILFIQIDAATVLLTDGTVLKGEVVSENEDQIVIETVVGRLTVLRDLIQMFEQAGVDSEQVDVERYVLNDAFGVLEDQIAYKLISTVSVDTAAFYRALDRSEKGTFLAHFWQSHNPLVLQYYYGYYLGQRHYTVSDAYFERGDVIPKIYRTGANGPDEKMIEVAHRLLEKAVIADAEDKVALCALAYIKLERDDVSAAENLFLKALQKDRKFVEARNGRALAFLKLPGRKNKAMNLANEAVALDDDYIAALYTRAMCHLVRIGTDRVDMDHYFGKVIDRDPGHYDAHFKLGAFYESLRYLDKAVAAYSRQLEVNPGHKTAPERLARVAMLRRAEGKATYTLADLKRLSQKDPVHHLPLLAEVLIGQNDWAGAENAFDRYLDLLDVSEKKYYTDLSLVAKLDVITEYEQVSGAERQRLLRKFWVMQDPTPTTEINERRVEHLRRVYQARLNFSEGIKAQHGRGWDRRGDVYIRFGAPDHRSWSDNLVFETDAKVAKVKNRLNNLAYDALEEVQANKHIHGSSDLAFGMGTGPETAEIRGRPTFPLPQRMSVMNDGSELNYKWESWIYTGIGEGFEITFLDQVGDGIYDFAPVPPNSRHWALWQQLAPETVVARVTNKTPSVYAFDYGGEPMGLFLYTANFRGQNESTDLEVYLGVPVSEMDETAGQVRLQREVVVYDGNWRPVFHDSTEAVEKVVGTSSGTLMIDQVRVPMKSGPHFLAVQVRDPLSDKIQIFKGEVYIDKYRDGVLGVSDLELAGDVRDAVREGKFVKGEVQVVPLPSKTFLKGQPVYVYYEVYNLTRDAFGQTKYRVDYVLKGQDASSVGARIFGGLGKLLGQASQTDGVTISYEHLGEVDWESIYVGLDVTSVDKPEVELTVVVTDLNAPATLQVEKAIHFVVVGTGTQTAGQASE